MAETKKIRKETVPKNRTKKVTKKVAKVAPNSFWIIKTGGKQYKVASGNLVKVEKIRGKKEGDKVSFDDILLSFDGKDLKIGTPVVSGAKVSGIVEKEGRNKKVVVIKYKQKSRYFKNRGHRQPFMTIKIA